jgi:hypothetical protein
MPTSAVLMVSVPDFSRPLGSGRLRTSTWRRRRFQRGPQASLLDKQRTTVSDWGVLHYGGRGVWRGFLGDLGQ